MDLFFNIKMLNSYAVMSLAYFLYILTTTRGGLLRDNPLIHKAIPHGGYVYVNVTTWQTMAPRAVETILMTSYASHLSLHQIFYQTISAI